MHILHGVATLREPGRYFLSYSGEATYEIFASLTIVPDDLSPQILI